MQVIATPSAEVLATPSVRWAWIQFQLKVTGRSFAELARQQNVAKETLTKVKTAHYPRMERVIADALGLDATKLFPERYDKHGLPNLYKGRKSIPGKSVKAAKEKRNIRAGQAA
jgi:Ner family transcriptional regulator